jgi:hypothetical protein
MNRFTLLIALFIVSFRHSAGAQEWISLFDGKTLDGWRPSENKAT